MVFGPENFSAKSVEKWPKDFSRPKKGQNVISAPKKFSAKLVKKWPKFDQKMFLGLKGLKKWFLV